MKKQNSIKTKVRGVKMKQREAEVDIKFSAEKHFVLFPLVVYEILPKNIIIY